MTILFIKLLRFNFYFNLEVVKLENMRDHIKNKGPISVPIKYWISNDMRLFQGVSLFYSIHYIQLMAMHVKIVRFVTKI
jgi:hypothetical protein